MSAVTGATAVVFLLACVGLGVFLYVLVRAEHGRRTETDRGTAERMARRDTDEDRDGWR